MTAHLIAAIYDAQPLRRKRLRPVGPVPSPNNRVNLEVSKGSVLDLQDMIKRRLTRKLSVGDTVFCQGRPFRLP